VPVVGAVARGFASFPFAHNTAQRSNRVTHPLSSAWRTAAAFLVAMALAVPVLAQSEDDNRNSSQDNSHSGKVVSTSDNQLVMSSNGDQHSHKVNSDTKITLNGKSVDLDDLKKGDSIRVTMGSNNTATAIKATRSQAGDSQQQERSGTDDDKSHTGKVVSTSENQLVMTSNGNHHSHKVNSDTRITLNGESVEIDDLRKGDAIRVTMGGNNTATAIKATRSQGSASNRNKRSDAEEDERATRRASSRDGRDENERGSRRENEDRPFLGVMLAESTGGGVLIPDVYPDGPAAEAGLRAGDYVLEINGTEVESPDEFDRQISKLDPGDSIDLLRWRDGNKKHLQFKTGSRQEFMTKHFQQQVSERGRSGGQFADRGSQSQAWLGVVLGRPEDEDQGGASIDRVYKGSPADKAGLEKGDTLVAINDQMVKSARTAADILDGLEPNDEVNLTIRHNDERKTVTATLADRSQVRGLQHQAGYPGEFGDHDGGIGQGQYGGHPLGGGMPEHSYILEQERHLAMQHHRIEQLCRDVLDEVRSLREEVQSLKKSLD
jgi:hypothetical protein